jgi:NADPH:quinone reductase-like Zn-dependent oxidoreductase
VQDRYGSPDVLEFRDIDEPVVGDDDVLVRVRAAGCGPDVWHLMTGLPYFVRLMPGFRKLRKGVRGRDAAGVVEAVGGNVTSLKPGDEVMGIVEGSFAELGVGREGTLVRKPERLTFEEAAAAPISGLTALQALRDVAKMRPGQRVLVIGAGGGVGTLTVQLAAAWGAEVTGVCGPSKADLVLSLGAVETIDYARTDVTDGTRRWDVIVDTAGRRPLRALRRALVRGGTLAIVGGEGGADGPAGSSGRSSAPRCCRW